MIGLDFDGGPPATPGLNGIRVLSVGLLHVEDCVIRNFKAASNNLGRRLRGLVGKTYGQRFCK
jgi:hypothetical protein